MKETLRHQQAFEFYYTLGPERSLYKVAEHFGVSRTSATKWCNDFNWEQRVRDRDTKNMEEVRKQNDEDVVEKMLAYRKIVSASVADYMKRLKAGSVEINNVSDFARLVRLDIELCGFIESANNIKQSTLSEETQQTLYEIEQGLSELKAGEVDE